MLVNKRCFVSSMVANFICRIYSDSKSRGFIEKANTTLEQEVAVYVHVSTKNYFNLLLIILGGRGWVVGALYNKNVFNDAPFNRK